MRGNWTKVICKFLLGLVAGVVLASQFQSFVFLSTSELCSHFKVPPVRRHPLRLENPEPSEAVPQEPEGRQLLLVGVMTADKYISTRARAVYETWGQRVPGKILFFTAGKRDNASATDRDDEQLPVIRLKGVDDSYPPQKKSFMMLKYIYENYGGKFEWFMRADDDVFVRMEKLELFLRNINSSRASFIGQAGKGILVF